MTAAVSPKSITWRAGSAVPALALGDVLYHAPERRRLQDVLSCVREHVTLDNAGRLQEANAGAISRARRDGALVADLPGAVRETLAVFSASSFPLRAAATISAGNRRE
jgi:error-prone DNA polymerase